MFGYIGLARGRLRGSTCLRGLRTGSMSGLTCGKGRSMRIHLMALCFGLALTPGAAVTAHANYTAIVLPDLGGASDSAVEAINSVGESVGYSVTPSGDSTRSCGRRMGTRGQYFWIKAARARAMLSPSTPLARALDRLSPQPAKTLYCGLPRAQRRRCWARAAESERLPWLSMARERASGT